MDRQQVEAARRLAQGRQWEQAAEAYHAAVGDGGADALELQDQLLRNLSLNLTDLGKHRPEVRAVLDRAPSDPRFGVDIMPNGRPTITFEGRRMTEGSDPIATLAGVMEKLKPARLTAKPMAIFGTGDGYLMVALARHPMKLPPPLHEKQQCVYIVESSPGNLLLALMIHDMSGETGPIRQERFRWHVEVGVDQAMASFERELRGDLYLQHPELDVAILPDGPRLSEGAKQVLVRTVAEDRERARRLAERAAAAGVERYIEALGPNPPRKPRALVLTTRFSTVIQFSSADCAEGLRQAGWDVELAIEQTGYHGQTKPGWRELMLRFDPDVILQIDHYRAEHGTGEQTLFPKEIPFLCWAQDNLTTLTNREAGAAQGPTDFFLTALGDWYEREWGYPRECVIPLHKLTRVPALPEKWESNGLDLTYVSNASKPPETATEELLQYYGNETKLLPLVRKALDLMRETYERGDALSGPNEIKSMLLKTGERVGLSPEEIPTQLGHDLFERVNNIYYRQQALNWVADIAEEMGLKLGIYGHGWEKHPRFGKYARGVVAYGPDLEALTRASKISFQIVPYFCLHQRLLDGLAAGGFFLVRSHPSDQSLRRIAKFVSAHLNPSIRTVEKARQSVSPSLREELEVVVGGLDFVSNMLDPIAFAWTCIDLDYFPNGAEMPPRISEVSFSNKGQLQARINRFLPDAALRRDVAIEQRDAVVHRLSYEVGMRRVMGEVHKRLKSAHARPREVLLA